MNIKTLGKVAARWPLSAVLAACFLLGVVLLAVLGPTLIDAQPNATDLASRLQGPSREHLLGTDDLGRDIAARMAVGARISLQASVQAIVVAFALGLPTGLVSGFRPGVLSRALDGVANVLMAFPPIFLAIAILAILGPGLTNAMVAIGCMFAPRLYRIVRAAASETRVKLFVVHAQLVGVNPVRVLSRHVLPNISTPLIVYASFAMGTALLIEASLSFLGLGVQPPEASWGAMIGRAFRDIGESPTGVYIPGLAITLTVLSFNLLGDGLREVLQKR